MEKDRIKWTNSENMFQAFQLYEDGKPVYPVICPECGKQRTHIYIHRYNDTHQGGVWIWCSECHSFSHASYTVPIWWANYIRMDQEKLCADILDELIQYEDLLDEHMNSQLMKYCMSDNVCNHCLHKNHQNPKLKTCPECGEETFMATLDGPSMIISCSNCGLNLVGASFYPPCHTDAMDYTFTVKDIPKEKKIKVAKLFKINAKVLLTELRNKGEIQYACELDEAEKVCIELKQLGIECNITPDLLKKYPDLIGCKCF